MSFITFDLIGRLFIFIIIALLFVRALWWCVNYLPIKIVDMLGGWRAFLEFLKYRDKFKKWLEERK